MALFGSCVVAVLFTIVAAEPPSAETLAATALSPKVFPTDAVLETPAWVELLTLALLCAIFAAAVQDAGDAGKKDDLEDPPKTIKLVRPHAIALRSAAALGVWGICLAAKDIKKLMPISAPCFPSLAAEVDAPDWGQLLVVSMLCLVFSLVIQADADDKDAPQVGKLVRPHAIARRFAAVSGLAGIYGAAKEFMPMVIALMPKAAPRFPSLAAELDTPEWCHLLSISVLCLVFALVIQADAGDKDAPEVGKLVRPHAIALRFAAVTGVCGVYGAIKSSTPSIVNAWEEVTTLIPYKGAVQFPAAEAESNTPVWGQLLVVSVLLAVFAAVVRDANTNGKDDGAKNKDSSKTVDLVRPHAIAMRLAAVAGLFAAGEAASAWGLTNIIRDGASSELALKGGLLFAGTSLVLLGGQASGKLAGKDA